jgi:hypothetical protein
VLYEEWRRPKFGDKLLLMDINGLLAQGKLYNMASALWVNLEKVGGWIGRMMIAWLGILYGTESGIRPSLATFHRSFFSSSPFSFLFHKITSARRVLFFSSSGQTIGRRFF